MLHYETISPGTLQILKDLQALPCLRDTRLVGGTALALQLGHRRSIDLDLFGKLDDAAEEIQNTIAAGHSLTISKDSKNIHTYRVDNVKVDIVNYSYAWTDSPICEEGIVLAGPKDIAAMKVAAIIGRGTKKDFIDLYFLLRQFSMSEILNLYLQKYPDGSLFIAMKSLLYFEDAEREPMPAMFEDVEWPAVKERIRREVSSL